MRDWIRSDGEMARCSEVLKVLIFLTCSLHLSSSVTHSMQYILTGVTPGINFPEFTEVGQVDGQQFVYYDSNIREMIPKTEWILKVSADDPDYWNRETQKLKGAQETFKVGVDTLMRRFNQSTGVHTWQMMCSCERDDNGTFRGYTQYGYDGEDFINFDLKTLTYTAAKPQAVITKHKWDNIPGMTVGRKNYLEYTCIKWLKKYVGYGRETLERKVPPTASVFQKHSSPEVVCHATGFFPKTVMITWQKDGEDVHEDVELRETLPNQDGSFQKRSILTVSAEDLQKHTYTCVIQHCSLGEKMVLDVPKGGGSGGAPIGIIVGGVVVLLAIVVSGIRFWKKNSDFKTVSQNSTNSSEEELIPPTPKVDCVSSHSTERKRGGDGDEDHTHTHTKSTPNVI